MRAWTVDADDIRVEDDFDESLLHRTPEIDGFLRSDRDDKFIVIGTKGFGKTLLLKAKRILYQREGRAACLPERVLLDKPIGDKMIMNAAFLIELERESEFDAAVNRIAKNFGDRLNFKYTGPWPPYNFVNIRLKLERGTAG